jgi:hypothetical protein
MQIHLFDCKSNIPIRRGLGSNKLNLCMLVLSQLRDTYWSASVVYRLFERAQKLLAENERRNSAQSAISPSVSNQIQPQSRGQDTEVQHHQSQDLQQQQQQQQQQMGHQGSVGLMPETIPAANEQTAPLWMNDCVAFGNVDQLLDPSFVISDDAFQSFFGGYGNGMDGVFDQTIPLASNLPNDMMYRG